MSESSAFPVRTGAVGPLGTAASAKPGRPLTVWAPGNLESAGFIWSWFAVMLAALVGLKVILIVSQGQSLYETHWRVGGFPLTWLNYAAFYALVVLGALAVVRLSADCQRTSVKTVRAANAVILLVGLIFVLLTFHNGNKNYLYPVLSGVLRWSSLVPYLANSFFFNQPFLAGWLFVYIGVYYFLARTGRERWVLLLTGAFAIVYAVIYLQEFIARRNELLVIDVFGVVSVIMAWSKAGVKSRTSGLRVLWSISPGLWTLFFGWAVLRFDGDWRSKAAVYLVGLTVGTLLLFSLAGWVVRKNGNPVAWTWVAPFLLTGFFILANSNYPISNNYNHLLCLAATFPRYIIADVTLLCVLVGCAFLHRRANSHARLWWLYGVGLALLIIAGIDLRLTQIMGVRLGWDVFMFGDSPKMMLRMAQPYLPGALLGLAVVILVYSLAWRAMRAWLERYFTREAPSVSETESRSNLRVPDHTTAGLTYVTALAFALGVLGLTIADSDKAAGQSLVRLVRTSPLWKRVSSHPLSPQEFMSTANALGLGSFAVPSRPVQAPRDLNVLVVFMESSYNKHLSLFGSSEETQPLLTRYKDRMELFPNFFSAFAGSIYARFATFTSLYPTLEFQRFTQDRVPVKSLFEIFHERGYTCSMFYSSYFDYTGFRDFLKNRGLDEMYDADTMPGPRKSERVAWGLLEEETLGAIRNQLRQYAQDHRRFCLTYVPAAPHNPFDKIPKRFQKHKLDKFDDLTPLYLDELLYMDWVIASIVDELKETGLLDRTLVIITNDHGEMLGGKEGHVGHGWAITPQLANTPLILMDPDRQGFKVNKTIGTQVDLLPTILDRLHIPVPPDQLYEGISLDAGAERSERLGYLNSNKEFGIISGDKILLGDRESTVASGIAASGAVFSITNEGVKTVFVSENAGENTEPGTSGAGVAQSASGNPSNGKIEAGSCAGPLTFEARHALINRFDAFQENLLRNYSQYVKNIRGDKPISREP